MIEQPTLHFECHFQITIIHVIIIDTLVNICCNSILWTILVFFINREKLAIFKLKYGEFQNMSPLFEEHVARLQSCNTGRSTHRNVDIIDVPPSRWYVVYQLQWCKNSTGSCYLLIICKAEKEKRNNLLIIPVNSLSFLVVMRHLIWNIWTSTFMYHWTTTSRISKGWKILNLTDIQCISCG